MTDVSTPYGRVRVPAGTWIVDPLHSSVAFEVKYLMISTVRGVFREYDGRLAAADDDPSHSRVEGSAKVASLDTGNAERDAHLRSPAFFDAERYPEIHYVSKRINHIEAGRYTVTGELTIKDVTNEIELESLVEGVAQDPWGDERVGIAVRGLVDRRDFGLTWRQPLERGGVLVGEEVRVLIDISAVRS
jgi:polyisoprenoid-binding protein YceI